MMRTMKMMMVMRKSYHRIPSLGPNGDDDDEDNGDNDDDKIVLP